MEELKTRLSKLDKKQKIFALIFIIILLLSTFMMIYKNIYSKEDQYVLEDEVSQTKDKVENLEDNDKEDVFGDSKMFKSNKKQKIVIHIVGEINKPGVYKLDDGSRIIDAIKAADGETENAYLSMINLAYVLEDGVQIYIPSVKDYQKMQKQENEEQREYIRTDAGNNIISSTIKNEEKRDNSKVNINTASIEKLKTLPGIGEQTAKLIIEYRQKNGKFKDKQDIKKIKGLGDSKYNKLKDLITI